MDRVDTGGNCGRRVWKSEKGGRTESEGGNRQKRLHLESRTPPWAGL